MPAPIRSPYAKVAAIIVGAVIALSGLYMAYGEYELLALGGSAYYLPAGLLMIAAGGLIAARRMIGVWIFAFLFLITLIWAVWEAGFAFWPLAARVGMLAVFALLVALLVPQLIAEPTVRVKRSAYGVAGVLAVCLVAAFIGAFQRSTS